MAYTLGIVLFAVGILFAVCVHEIGHMVTAKAFGMKVTRYFVGFGPTIWSFRRGETEYGVKALPLGGFVKIVGMTPQDDDVEPGDEPRAMWRFAVWKRTIVMAAGSVAHFILAFAALWVMFVLVGVPDPSKVDSSPATVATVSPCVQPTWRVDAATGGVKPCAGEDPRSPAAQAGLRQGDVITAINGQAIPTYAAMRNQVRALGDRDATLTYRRDGRSVTANVHIYAVDRVRDTVDSAKKAAQITPSDLERVGMLGVSATVPQVRTGPIEGATRSGSYLWQMTGLTFRALGELPAKVPNLITSLTGKERDPETPVSVIGATRFGGELAERSDWTAMLSMFALLNLFFGLFNLLPLLPMDGGHIAIAWFERVRSWLYVGFGRADPGRVDYYKLTPITLTVIAVLAVFVVLTGTADIVNPISVPR